MNTSQNHSMNQPSSWLTSRREDVIKELAEKRAIDHFEAPLDKLHELSRQWCYFQAERDLEVYQMRREK